MSTNIEQFSGIPQESRAQSVIGRAKQGLRNFFYGGSHEGAVMLDLHDTIVKFEEVVRDYIKGDLGPDFDPTLYYYNPGVINHLPAALRAMEKFLGTPTLMQALQASPDCSATLRKFPRRNIALIICTAASYKLGQDTMELLTRLRADKYITALVLKPNPPNSPNEQEYKVAAAIASRVPHSGRHAVEMVFEDNPNNARALAQAGIPVSLINRPWNQTVKPGEYIQRFDTLNDAVDNFLGTRQGSLRFHTTNLFFKGVETIEALGRSVQFNLRGVKRKITPVNVLFRPFNRPAHK